MGLCGSRKYPYPTMEGIGNSEGVGVQRSRKFQKGSGSDEKITFQGVKFRTQYEIATYRSGRSFLKKTYTFN